MATFEFFTGLDEDYKFPPAVLDALVESLGLNGKLDTASAAELIRDTLAATIVAGTNITITNDDTGDTLTIAGTAGKKDAIFTHTPALVAGTVGIQKLPNRSGATRTIHLVAATLGTPAVGGSVIVDVNRDGSSIFTNQANRPTIAAGASEGVSGTPDVTTWPNGSYLTVDVDSVGAAGTTGAALTVVVIWS